MDIIKQHAIILPLYLYDHGGITMNTTGFSCPWDSGQVGWIYCTKEDFIKETGYTEKELFEEGKAEALLKGEVETYDQYLTGDVYGFVLEDEDGNQIDSCWGFYGSDWKEFQFLIGTIQTQMRHRQNIEGWRFNSS